MSREIFDTEVIPEESKFFEFVYQKGAKYRYAYEDIAEEMNEMREKGEGPGVASILRSMGEADLFFFSYFVLGLKILNHPWIVQRIYEVQDSIEKGVIKTMELWCRGHFKSTILTYCLPLWLVAKSPEERVGIFSHTRQKARGAFLGRIKSTLERNEILRTVWSDVFYMNPESEASRHSLLEGITVKRRGDYSDQTFEAWGVIERMPTGSHFTVLIMDDLVTQEAVSTYEQRMKVKKGYQLAQNLVDENHIEIVVGTFYHYDDLYVHIRSLGEHVVRTYPGEKQDELGRWTGEGFYWSKEVLEQKKRSMGTYVFNCQVRLDPVPEEEQTFKREWLEYWRAYPNPMNIYILVDPAGSKTKGNKREIDYTVMWVVGLGPDKTRYILDCIRDQLSLPERFKALWYLYKKWGPERVKKIGYEKFGKDSDIEHIEEKAKEKGVRLPIVAVQSHVPKPSRIAWLLPRFEEKQILIPEAIYYTDVMGKKHNLIIEFINEEYLCWSAGRMLGPHDDMLDCLAMLEIKEFGVESPIVRLPKIMKKQEFDPFKKGGGKGTEWITW